MWSLVSNVAIQHLVCNECRKREYVRDLEIPDGWTVSRVAREWFDDEHLCPSCTQQKQVKDQK